MTNYAELVKLCAACPIMRKIKCAHNHIIPLSLVYLLTAQTHHKQTDGKAISMSECLLYNARVYYVTLVKNNQNKIMT